MYEEAYVVSDRRQDICDVLALLFCLVEHGTMILTIYKYDNNEIH